MQPDLHPYANAAWIAVGIVWVAGALTTKRTARSETGASRLFHFLLATVGFTLAFRNVRYGSLGWQFVPDSAFIAYSGLVLTVAGGAFAVWARIFLGRNWSGAVTIKHNHTIIRRGPYAIVRHPIYSGGLLALLGNALVVGEVRGLAALALVFIAWWTKLSVEERFLSEQFGAEYTQYQREVKALIPFVL